MRYSKEKIYELLPAIYREHDLKLGKPLEALLKIIAEQVANLENDIENLYENWFIETCDEWAIPYIGDLVGANLLVPVPKRIISARTWVANTIHYRRRKGTLLILDQLSRDVSGWTAISVEFFKLLAISQNINHLRPSNLRTPDLRDVKKLDLVDTPFDQISHSMEVRNIQCGQGFYNISNVGIFVWKLQAYPVLDAPAFDHNNGRYSFSQLGIDMPLFNSPLKENDDTQLSNKVNVVDKIRILDLQENLGDYYGIGKSILVKADGSILKAEEIIVSSLQDWTYIPPEGKVALDPSLGRMAFSSTRRPRDVHVTYFYGFSADIGGGFYDRGNIELGLDTYRHIPKKDLKVYKITKISYASDTFSSISATISQWIRDGHPDSAFEILDSEFYEESFELTLPENVILIIRSAPKQRPVLRADPNKLSKKQSLEIIGGKDSAVILDGLLIDDTLNINMKVGNLGILGINHCTLVPTEKPSIELTGNNNSQVVLQWSICGKIVISKSESKLILMDTIIDGNTSRQANRNDNSLSIKCYQASVERCTIFGRVEVDMLNFASNSIFTDGIISQRRQEGCVRFSYVSNNSKVPKCYNCIPNISITKNKSNTMGFPLFTSYNYGDPGYVQLHKDVGPEIFEGGDNGAEMGAFNHLYQAQRFRNLDSVLDDFLPLGIQKGIVIVN